MWMWVWTRREKDIKQQIQPDQAGVVSCLGRSWIGIDYFRGHQQFPQMDKTIQKRHKNDTKNDMAIGELGCLI